MPLSLILILFAISVACTLVLCWKQVLTGKLSEQDIKYKCFICGINRDVFDARMIDSTAGKTGAQGLKRRNQNGSTTNQRKGAISFKIRR